MRAVVRSRAPVRPAARHDGVFKDSELPAQRGCRSAGAFDVKEIDDRRVMGKGRQSGMKA